MTIRWSKIAAKVDSVDAEVIDSRSPYRHEAACIGEDKSELRICSLT